jgi:uncharacterized protein
MVDCNLDIHALPEFKDLLLILRENLILPTPSYKLKDVAKIFGFEGRHPDMDGFDAALYYSGFMHSKDEKVIKKLKEYNEDDTLALWHILKKIDKMQLKKPYSIKELSQLK